MRMKDVLREELKLWKAKGLSNQTFKHRFRLSLKHLHFSIKLIWTERIGESLRYVICHRGPVISQRCLDVMFSGVTGHFLLRYKTCSIRMSFCDRAVMTTRGRLSDDRFITTRLTNESLNLTVDLKSIIRASVIVSGRLGLLFLIPHITSCLPKGR